MADRRFERIGVVGAGTMGAGISLTALAAGYAVTLTDVEAQALDSARQYIAGHLERKGHGDALKRLELASDLSALAGSDVVIEAVTEDLALKQRLLADAGAICPPPVVLASNTSTLSITEIASACPSPDRVAGMHFFNPAPVMKLVEVARGAATDEQTIEALVMLAEQLGKTAVVTADTPGFVVNRVARPFYNEPLRLLGEGVAAHHEIDTLLTLGAGFRMGPFQLMDLIGIDVNFAAAKAMYASSFGESRYRPHRIQQQMVSHGQLGRKSGAGFYVYQDGETSWEPPQPPEPTQTSGYVLLSEGSWGPNLGKLLVQAGYTLSETHGDVPVAAVVISGTSESIGADLRRYDRGLGPDIPILCQTVEVAYSELAAQLRHPERLVGFDSLFAAEGRAIAVTSPDGPIRGKAEALLRPLGKLPVWVGETPGMVVSRVVACLANEAAFAVGEGVAQPEAVDTAMQLGVNYPLGPIAWAEQLGFGKVVAVLDHLRSEYGEERYRVAPQLRRWARMRPDPLERFTRW